MRVGLSHFNFFYCHCGFFLKKNKGPKISVIVDSVTLLKMLLWIYWC